MYVACIFSDQTFAPVNKEEHMADPDAIAEKTTENQSPPAYPSTGLAAQYAGFKRGDNPN